MNEEYFSTVKNGQLAIYNYNIVLGQLIVVPNQPKNIDEYQRNKDEVK